MQLARLCGIEEPDTRVVQVLGGRDILLVEHFDRRPGEQRIERILFGATVTVLGFTQDQVEQGRVITESHLVSSGGPFGLMQEKGRNVTAWVLSYGVRQWRHSRGTGRLWGRLPTAKGRR